jgi:hypothetical protein
MNSYYLLQVVGKGPGNIKHLTLSSAKEEAKRLILNYNDVKGVVLLKAVAVVSKGEIMIEKTNDYNPGFHQNLTNSSHL